MKRFKRLKDRIAAFVGLAMLYFSPVSAQTWERIQPTIRSRFPDVRQIPTRTLAEWMTNSAAGPTPGLTLVDVREPAEFSVSHLRGARNCRSVAEIEKLVKDKASRVVVYCSVGYRSSSMAAKLQRSGFTNVFNLEGSIFAWANEGRPVFRGGAELRPARVHPYDRKWGQLLKEELRFESGKDRE